MTSDEIFRVEDRRAKRRYAAEFYAIEVDERGRYLRWVTNMSDHGLLIECPLADAFPGRELELELPRRFGQKTLRVHAQVVYITPEGHMGLRVTSSSRLPIEALGGRLLL